MRVSFSLVAIIASVACAIAGTTPALSAGDGSKSWNELQDAGTQALDANRYWEAEPLLHQAVIKAGSFGAGDMRLAKSLGELGRLYTIRGRYADAEPYLEEELFVKETALGRDTGHTIPAMGSLIRFYLTHGTVSKADPMCEELLSFVEGKIKEPTLTRPKIKFKKGMSLEGWAGTAAPVARDPLIEWAIACDALGNVYRIKEKYDYAERLFKAALDLKTTVLGKDHLSLANSYDSLGMLCLDRKEFAQAEYYLSDALAITEKTLPPGDPQVFARLDKLAKCLIKEGKMKQAEDLYVRAQAFYKNDSGTNAEQARALYALGCLYCDEKKYDSAAHALGKALHIADEFHGPASVSLVPYLQKYAYALYHLGRKPEVDQLRARANNIAPNM
jgi:tetratricopeptide (TPR) repeat protein